jgi:hypothetical protein
MINGLASLLMNNKTIKFDLLMGLRFVNLGFGNMTTCTTYYDEVIRAVKMLTETRFE